MLVSKVKLFSALFTSSIAHKLVGWGCRIHRLHLCREVKSPLNKCPGYDTKQSDGALGNAEYFIAIAPRSTLTWSGRT